jgi:hypothetical protein
LGEQLCHANPRFGQQGVLGKKRPKRQAKKHGNTFRKGNRVMQSGKMLSFIPLIVKALIVMRIFQSHGIHAAKPRHGGRLLILAGLMAVMLVSACAKKSQCPIYWEGTSGGGGSAAGGGASQTDWKVETNATKPADGGDAGGQTAGSGDAKTTSEFPMVRVKRDKNGIVTKRAMPRNKVKRTDPRKAYKGT